jgi:hypothetical protein
MPRALKLVPISIEGVITHLMQERSGSRPSASLKEWRKVLEDLSSVGGNLRKHFAYGELRYIGNLSN